MKKCPRCGINNYDDYLFCEYCGESLDAEKQEEKLPEPPKLASAEDLEMDGTVLVKYIGKGGDIIIPDGVTEISPEAFKECTALTGVTIPDGVTKIGKKAFYGCSELTRVNIPEGVEMLEWWTFYGCKALTDVSLPQSLTRIDGSTFSTCTALTDVSLPKNLTKLEGGVVNSCTALKSITIPEGVTEISYLAFVGCKALEEINADDNNDHYRSLDGILYNKELTAVVRCPYAKKSVIIPDSVTEIADGAFEKCSALERVRIPDSVTSIGEDAFCWCSSLKNLELPESLRNIGRFAFRHCESLVSVTIPKSVTSIDIKAFEECGSLILRVYNGTEGAAYAGRELLKHELLPNEDDFVMNGTAIVKYTGWIGYVLIPDTVTSIEDGAFKGCKALHSVTIPASVTSIGKRAFRTGSFLSGSRELTLRVYPDTEGERYAKANDIKYELIK